MGAVITEAIRGRQAHATMRLHPCLYEINTRVLLADIARALNRRATLDDIPDAYLERLAREGFDWLWFMGVWRTGIAGRTVSLANAELRHDFEKLLPDVQEQDVCGSSFAIQRYDVHPDLGGNAGLARLRHRIHARGMRLLLDFVPNHTAPDHDWVRTHPEYYVPGSEEQLRHEPNKYTRVYSTNGYIVLAYGRDPCGPGWPDTLQLNYANPRLQDAMASELERIAGTCDGVRCDMAMLVLPGVFARTWGLGAAPFWPEAIGRIRAHTPDFLFVAEAYWDLEWTLQQQGFDYTYDKRLYDRLRDGQAQPVRDHFRANLDFQQRCVRFLENYDESRAAAAFAGGQHQAAAILTYLCPGLRLFHQGQTDGLKRRTSVHLSRSVFEPGDAVLRQFYERLLSCLRHPTIRGGEWRLLECAPAWHGNPTHDSYICFGWQGSTGSPLLVTVNFAPYSSQCYVCFPAEDLPGGTLRLQDLMGEAVYFRNGDDLRSRGLYLDLPAWGYHVFELTGAGQRDRAEAGKAGIRRTGR